MLFKMKELWAYLTGLFPESRKEAKKIGNPAAWRNIRRRWRKFLLYIPRGLPYNSERRKKKEGSGMEDQKQKVYDALDKQKIKYEVVEHEPVYTMEDMDRPGPSGERDAVQEPVFEGRQGETAFPGDL